MRAFLIDTEGFSGVGSLTSRTYEANMFGITYLLSSAVVYNSMFPVDASTVSQMNRHALRTMQMIKSLSDANVWTHRRQPSFLWSVQSFNMHQLANTGLDAAALLSHLRNASSKPEAGAAAITSLIAPTGASSSAAWLVERLFESPTLLPIRRPNYFVHQLLLIS